MKIKKGDLVKIITGKDRGKVAKVKYVLPDKNKIVVEGVNMIKKHQKNVGNDKPSGIIEYEAPINASNAMVIDPETNKPTRVGYKIENGKKFRIAKKSNTKLDK